MQNARCARWRTIRNDDKDHVARGDKGAGAKFNADASKAMDEGCSIIY